MNADLIKTLRDAHLAIQIHRGRIQIEILDMDGDVYDVLDNSVVGALIDVEGELEKLLRQ